MAVLPSRVLTRDNIYSGYRDFYSTNHLGRKALGYPRGIYKGFTPQLLTDPTNVLDLTVDTLDGISVLKVKSSDTEHLMDLFLDSNITLDFTGQTFLGGNATLYVIARSSYKIGNVTTADIFTRSTPGNGISEVNICAITKPGAVLVIDTSLRNVPLATAGNDFGFMATNSVNNLTIVTTTADEVIAARVDTDTSTAQANLSTRLLQDYNTVDNRLSRVIDLTQGNSHTMLTAQTDRTKLNISGSLGNLTRAFEPKVTFDNGGAVSIGSLGSDGAITTSPDNLVIPINTVTGQRYIDGVGSPVFGRLQPVQTISAAGITISFVNAQTTVSGDGDFTALGIEVGDTILAPDGNVYEISNTLPITAASFSITPSYQNQSATSNSLTFNRFEVTFFSIINGVETSFAFGAGDIMIQPFFNSVVSLDKIRQDARASFLKTAQTPIPTATTTLAGEIQFGTDGETTSGEVIQADDSRLVDICKTDGSTPFSAVQSYDSGVTLVDIINDEHLVTKEYVDQFGLSQIDFRESQVGIVGANSFTAVFPFDVVTAYAGMGTLLDSNLFGNNEGIRDLTSLSISGNTVIIEWNQANVSQNTVRMIIIAAGH